MSCATRCRTSTSTCTSMLPETIGDFDDRSFALLSLLEGDALLVMERFLMKRLPGDADRRSTRRASACRRRRCGGAPPILRDQLVLPYTLGRSFVAARPREWRVAGLRSAWGGRPPAPSRCCTRRSTWRGEAPSGRRSGPCACRRALDRGRRPGRGVHPHAPGRGSDGGAAGWGGDHYRTWDVGGRTLLAWRSTWDTADGRARVPGCVRGDAGRAWPGAARPAGLPRHRCATVDRGVADGPGRRRSRCSRPTTRACSRARWAPAGPSRPERSRGSAVSGRACARRPRSRGAVGLVCYLPICAESARWPACWPC